MWGHPMPVLGALSPFLEPFLGHLSPKIDKVPEELTFEIPPRRALSGVLWTTPSHPSPVTSFSCKLLSLLQFRLRATGTDGESQIRQSTHESLFPPLAGCGARSLVKSGGLPRTLLAWQGQLMHPGRSGSRRSREHRGRALPPPRPPRHQAIKGYVVKLPTVGGLVAC